MIRWHIPPVRPWPKNLKPNWQHLLPVDTDLAGAALVRERNDIVETFIDMVQQPKQDVHALAHLRRITLLCVDHAAIEEPTDSAIHALVPADSSV